jgi:hypothetical protein
MSTWSRLRPLAPLAVAFGLACAVPTGDLDGSGLTETHHAIVDGVVHGELGQPLENVDVVLRFAESSLPAPSARTDGAGEFVLALAIYNGSAGADSAAATVYAFARPEVHGTSAANHADIFVRFAPKGQEAPHTRVSLKLPVF